MAREIVLSWPGQRLYEIQYNNDRAEPTEDFLAVEANPLDNILKEDNSQMVNYLKIDVEGAELEVVKGVQSTLYLQTKIL